MSDVVLRIGVIADTHIEPEEEAATAPRSNRRARRAVEILNRARPAVTIHLGDVVHPVPEAATRHAALAAADRILGGLRGPLHIVPGNHDIGDKPLPWMPAKTVRREWMRAFADRSGSGCGTVELGGARLLLLNSPVLNTGLDDEAEVRGGLERALADGSGARTFLFTHYPPFLVAPDEPGHYDNIDEPARGWLLGLCARHRVEALVAGHVHTRFLNQDGPTAIYTAPATGFARRDYSELFRTGPAPEFGRDDAAKLGVLVIDVLEQGYRVVLHRLDEPDELARREPNGRLGVFLRHPWAEVVEIPANPPTDALQRRRARNDHPLLAILELGLGVARVPADDLLDPAVRARVAILAERGCRFLALGHGLPGAALAAALKVSAAGILGYEVVTRLEDLEQLRADACVHPVELRLAPLSSSADLAGGEGQKSQRVAFGFLPEEIDRLTALDLKRDGVFGGVVARLAPGAPVFPALLPLVAAVSARELGLSVTIDALGATPEEAVLDEDTLARRVLEAAFAARALPDAEIVLDSLVDVDRGYYPRLGLIDRRGDLRATGRAVRTVNAIPPLREGGFAWTLGRDGVSSHGFESEDGIECLITGPPDTALKDVPLAVEPTGAGEVVVLAPDGSWVSRGDWTAIRGGVRLEPPLPLATPLLIRLIGG